LAENITKHLQGYGHTLLKIAKLGDIIRDLYYKTVPAPIRSLIHGRRRADVFRQAMSIFLDNPEACVHPENSTLTDLIYGWGNEAWSAREEFLNSCINHAMSSNGAILEVGSGLSTLLIAAVAKRRNQVYWVLEHKPDWANRVQSYLNQYDLQSNITTCALKDYATFCWYDAPITQFPKHFSLIVCDGPPSRTKGGRYGLVPVMRKHIAPGCVILLDDGYRREECDIAERWCQELGGNFCIEGVDKPYIVMKVT
jgi:Methyltransferase domain